MPRPRARDLGLAAGELPPGPKNTIADVAGVLVGHTTLAAGAGALRPGAGPVRTGVTVVLPHGGNLFHEKVPAAVHTINGFGKAFGFEQVRELGVIESPIALTNTLNVGLVADALVQHAIRESPEIGVSAGTVNVLVAECNDGFLNDIQGRHVRADHVLAAIEAASGQLAEGAVGAGAGTVCYGWKGGIGTASRLVPSDSGGYTVGALAQTNFGRPSQLTIRGVHVGGALLPPAQIIPPQRESGSVVVVLATDAPLTGRQLGRLCVRAAAGLARTGSVYGHGSGDFAIAFSTATRIAYQPATLTTTRLLLADEGRTIDWLFTAVVESVEEAVINSLCAAETVLGRDGHTAHALPLDEVVEMIRRL